MVAAGAGAHHARDEEAWKSSRTLVLFEADNCAAAERRTRLNEPGEHGRWDRTLQLLNPFSRVRNPHETRPGTSPRLSYLPLPRPGPNGPEWHVPVLEEGQNDSGAYRTLWNAFEEEFGALKKNNGHRNVHAVLHLLEKYTSAVPSITLRIGGADADRAAEKHADISLFDHLKTTAAIMLCLLDYYREQYGERFEKRVLIEEITGEATWAPDAPCPFLLVGGDISGVQRFIYTISSKGALKSLKGRSFFLELFLELTVDRILEELDLFRCNVIFTGGGHLYIIVPNTKKAAGVLRSVEKEANEYLLENFAGALEIFIRWVPFNKAALRDVSGLWGKLSLEIERAKKRRWEGFLDRLFGGPAEPHRDCYTSRCEVCGREDKPLGELAPGITEGILACDGCREQYVLGDMLQKASAETLTPVVYRWDGQAPEGTRVLPVGKNFLSLSAKYDVGLAREASAVYHVNEWNLAKFRHPQSRPLLAGIYLPPKKELRELESMAEAGIGASRLGVIRMDVDRLGRVFSSAVPKDERSFALMTSISRNLSLFFKYHINGILADMEGYPRPQRIIAESRGESFKRLVSVVYAGGDDVFLIGHWLDVLEAALDIRNAFAVFTANPFITLSCGMALGHVHDPVYRLAQAAGEAEEGLAKRVAGRRTMVFFERHALPWEEGAGSDVRALCEFLSILAPFLDVDDNDRRLVLRQGGLSIGFLYRFYELVRQQRKLGGWIVPKLAYIFGRTTVSENLVPDWRELKDYVFSRRAGGWRHLEVGLMIILMALRKGEK
ncbi:CRISPR-associated protein Csm1 [Thermodesulforhabdus norvegica]|uniref:CRISPR system single-strand-specific deoxyribonuclease Cas10/Csm1 (subtype III-A) n=2 Tax=Thermodesulforhabdus norvegica TaxID=39841 RepID=A0A1I4TB19_9BACT|nr:CRISPR-associated protein Csm1 [Thermodesulforhabdus norvegica]